MTQSPWVEYPPTGTYGRKLVSITIPAFSALPGKFALPSPHFVCLVCSDARGVPDRTIINAATALLDCGLVYLCAWGPDCERVRNLFEAAALVWNSHVAVLTVHLYEDVDDALGYFLDVASPAMDYTATCQTGLVLNIGMAHVTKHLQLRLGTDYSAVAEA